MCCNMNQIIPLLLLLYFSDFSSSGEVEDTTLHHLQMVLSTEPTIFYYPRTEVGSEPRIHNIVPRDVGGIPVPSSSPRYPSYSAPSRTGFFTPPLPPEYLNPFAGKPTLRGTNSDTVPHGQRRPIPPIPILRPSFEIKERVPLPPPDFTIPEQKPSGKKALNTPSRPNSHQAFENAFKDVVTNAAKSENSSTRSNDTDFEFVPIFQQYPSVSRILSGSSGRKHDLPDLTDRPSGPRHSHHNVDQMNKNLPPLKKELIIPVLPREPPPHRLPEFHRPPPPVDVPVVNKTEVVIPVVKVDDVIKKIENETVMVLTDVEESPSTDREEDEISDDVVADSELQKVSEGGVYLWSVAWDIHVYLIASLFAILAAYAVYNLALMRFYRHLLSRVYFVIIHVLIAVIGVVRAVYLFHDAYNVGHSYPDAVSRLLLNIACPLVTTTFATMFLFLVKTTEISVARPLQHPLFLILISLSHLALCICLDVTSDLGFELSGRKYLPLVCQGVYIALCVLLGSGYLYMYKTLAGAASRKQMEVFGAVYTTDVRRTRPVALCLTIRICLAVAMLILLMAVVQVYGAISVPDTPELNTQRWLWWAYQFSVRVIEVAICYLLVWAAMQRLHNEDEKETNSQNSTTGFALFPCGPCRTTDENIDDIYPAVCNTNQAIHNYSLRTGKKVYDDAFPLNTMEKRGNGSMTWNNYDEIGPGSEVVEVKDALTRKGLSTLTRSDSDRSSALAMGRLSGTLPGERRRPRDLPSSMLVDENGFVRFRSLAADDALRRAHPGNKSLPRRPQDVR